MELPHFRGAEAMAVGEEKNGVVALRGGHGKKPAHLILCEEMDARRCPRF
jgi:hypothetical protein